MDQVGRNNFCNGGGPTTFCAITARKLPWSENATPSTHPFYNDHGLFVVFSVNGTTLTKVAEVKIGQWPQGVAWSGGGKTLLAQSMVDNAFANVSFDGKNLKVTGQVKVTGGPDGIRAAGR